MTKHVYTTRSFSSNIACEAGGVSVRASARERPSRDWIHRSEKPSAAKA